MRLLARLVGYLADFSRAPRKRLWLELVWLGARDQWALHHYDRILGWWVTDRPRWRRASVRLTWLHHRQARRLGAVLDRIGGWPGFDLAGRYGALAAFLIAQHADHDRALQQRCLAAIESAALRGQVELRHVAYLTDRVRLAQGLPQLYGSQFMRGQPRPMADPDQVDGRRLAMGLEPLAMYAAKMAQRFPHLQAGMPHEEEMLAEYAQLRDRLPPGFVEGMAVLSRQHDPC